jgi:hypothetical protein
MSIWFMVNRPFVRFRSANDPTKETGRFGTMAPKIFGKRIPAFAVNSKAVLQIIEISLTDLTVFCVY